MSSSARDHSAVQKRFFERDPRRAATLVCRNPAFPRNLRKKLERVAELFAGCRRLLELGAGRGLELGFLLERLGAGTVYWGFDLALDPLAEARRRLAQAQRKRAFFSNGEGERLPFADGSFDGAFCIDVLHHAASQAGMLAEVRRILRPGGRVVCIEPNPLHPANLLYLGDPIERGLFRLTRTNAGRWVEAAGLASPRLTEMPVFFPGFPAAWGPFYDRAEALLGRVPGLRRLATTRVLTAVRP